MGATYGPQATFGPRRAKFQHEFNFFDWHPAREPQIKTQCGPWTKILAHPCTRPDWRPIGFILDNIDKPLEVVRSSSRSPCIRRRRRRRRSSARTLHIPTRLMTRKTKRVLHSAELEPPPLSYCKSKFQDVHESHIT